MGFFVSSFSSSRFILLFLFFTLSFSFSFVFIPLFFLLPLSIPSYSSFLSFLHPPHFLPSPHSSTYFCMQLYPSSSFPSFFYFFFIFIFSFFSVFILCSSTSLSIASHFGKLHTMFSLIILCNQDYQLE